MPVAMMTEAERVQRYGELVARYRSTKNRSVYYEVRRKSDSLTCSCPGWRFRRSCRHITRTEAGLADDRQADERVDRTMALARALNSVRLMGTGVELDAILTILAESGGRGSNNPDGVSVRISTLLDALDTSGIFAPREARPEAPGRPSRGLRVITLDDED